MMLVTLHYLTYSTYFGFQTSQIVDIVIFFLKTALNFKEQNDRHKWKGGEFTDLAILLKKIDRCRRQTKGKKETRLI